MKKARTEKKNSQPGNHVLINAYFKNYPAYLESISFSRRFFMEAINKGKFKILKTGFHKFKPQGLTGFFLLSESHLSFHTWPEENHIAIDLFTCSNVQSTKNSLAHITRGLKKMGVSKMECKTIKRGFVYTGL
ncbi:MAG: adenosylmethionine decarboxylase [Patescibacteria group bacterium]|nr:adenosylmethionine decarboxylase [Patescibacteria group bacterium]